MEQKQGLDHKTNAAQPSTFRTILMCVFAVSCWSNATLLKENQTSFLAPRLRAQRRSGGLRAARLRAIVSHVKGPEALLSLYLAEQQAGRGSCHLRVAAINNFGLTRASPD